MDSLLNLKLLNRNVCVSGIDIQMGHGVRDKLTDYWATKDQLYTPFCDTLMKWDHTFMSFVTYILLTTRMNLIGWTDILTATLWPWG